MNCSAPMWDAFWLGTVVGTCIILIALLLGIALYVRKKGAFTIAPPEPLLKKEKSE